MKRLLVVAVLFAAVSEMQAGSVMPCVRGYKKQASLGGSNQYSCVARAGVRGVLPLSQAACKPGLMVTSRTQATMPGGRQSYTCGLLRSGSTQRNLGPNGTQRMPGQNGGGVQHGFGYNGAGERRLVGQGGGSF